MSLDRAEFWNEKILVWESKRYDPKPGIASALLHRISSSSVHARLQLAAQIITAHKSKESLSLLDLGCGSGRLFSMLDAWNFKSRVGIDFSDTAISKGRSRFQSGTAEFICGDAIQTPWPKDSNYVTALGLLDWLDEEQIRQLFLKLEKRSFLFSFSELRMDARISIHSVYHRAISLRNNRAYYPRYHRFHDLVSLLEGTGYSQVHVHRDPCLRFGTFLSSHPVRVAEHA